MGGAYLYEVSGVLRVSMEYDSEHTNSHPCIVEKETVTCQEVCDHCVKWHFFRKTFGENCPECNGTRKVPYQKDNYHKISIYFNDGKLNVSVTTENLSEGCYRYAVNLKDREKKSTWQYKFSNNSDRL